MSGITAASSRERMASLLDSVELSTGIPCRLVYLLNLKVELLHSDTILLAEFLFGVLNLKAVQFRPVRKIRRREIGSVDYCSRCTGDHSNYDIYIKGINFEA
ncbi:hypothetical protein Nepgr_011594 [Nepenthes gracilis]|uniref:Uncharacterized protein n=1 Tax=Nepenthes gracilis TaxID=150966 RepID=A0AAD3SEG4_NEPGR|nr:hypothetical protein Nepgr_011594 [Nepenthes gracilis]